MSTDSLFPDLVPAPLPEPVQDERTPGERRRARHLAALERGQHPLSVALGRSLPLHLDARRDGDRRADGSPRCGSCVLRGLTYTNGNRTWPKCHAEARQVTHRRPDGTTYVGTAHPRITHGGGTDVAAWWPACRNYTPKEST